MSTIIKDGVGGSNLGEINSANQFEIKPANPVETSGVTQPNKVGSIRVFAENDAGLKTGVALLKPMYVDQYYRLYSAHANMLDSEMFNYVQQNTGKHTYLNTTMAIAWSAAGMLTNSGNITTLNTGVSFGTYAQFSLHGNNSLEAEISASFTQQPTTNTIIDFGLFQRGGANPYAPVDGAYFRLNSSGLQAVINSNSVEATSAVFNFTYDNNEKYKFYIAVTVKGVEFWINDVLYAYMTVPAGQGSPFMSVAVPLSVRHSIVGGGAGAIINFNLNNYSVIEMGTDFGDSLGTIGNRMMGSYQGLSGGIMGSLAGYANSANPVAAVPTNTTSTVLNALGGQGWETDTLAVTTDGIIMSYQVPLGTAIIQGKRLKLTGIKIDSFVQTTLTGGGYNAQFSLAFGHTSVSMATTESGSSKAPRRIALGSYAVVANAAALTQLPSIFVDFSQSPVYVNPGEFIAIVKKKVGTAPSAGTIAYTFTPIYSWE